MISSRIVFVCALAAVLAFGCGEHLNPLSVRNQPPTVRFEAASSPVLDGDDALHSLRWMGEDPDGRVDHYLVATNPRTLETQSPDWTVTRERARAVTARRSGSSIRRLPVISEPFDKASAGTTVEPVIIAVRAVDDRGGVSSQATRVYFGDNIAPEVRITSPRPSPLQVRLLVPTMRIHWEGSDPDGSDGRPVKYKYRLFRSSVRDYARDPDSIRREFAPDFAGWDTMPGDSTSKTYFDLPPGGEYLFVITALDADGGYDPVFTLSKNVLRFAVGFAETRGPVFTIFNESIFYRYPGGVARYDSVLWIHAPLPTNTSSRIQWFADVSPGAALHGYRWVLDPVDVLDRTPRSNERWDTGRWSQWSRDNTSATVGPFRDTNPHLLYIEAVDDLGHLSVGIVRIQPVRVRANRELLIVDDTRLRLDRSDPARPGEVLPPGPGPWPTAAELDTFLFARGGAPWKSYPPGTLSPRGLFDGYDFDTLNTRTGLRDLSVPFETLGRYRAIVWIVDPAAANNSRNGTNLSASQTAVRYMSEVARFNSLAAFIKGGGRVWLVGGGVGSASTAPYDDHTNNQPTKKYDNTGRELRPGRFMWETAHWRSGFQVFTDGPLSFRRYESNDRRRRDCGPARFLFPTTLSPRTPATDPIWPYRIDADFYPTTLDIEFLHLPNSITETRSYGGRHRKTWTVSTLDTLYIATGPRMPAEQPLPGGGHTVNPVMTLYTGRDGGPVVFTGLPIWNLSRRDARAMVDGVLGGMWGLRRRVGPS